MRLPFKHKIKFNLAAKLTALVVVGMVGVFMVVFGIRTHGFRNLMPSNSVDSNKTLEEYADEVLNTCSKVSYRPTCYEEEIPKLMDYISYKDAFEVTRIVQDKDPTFTYCHVLGHKLSARETAKDPSKWKDVITMAPSGICSNGAIHGAFQERFRSESLSPEEITKIKPELMDVCEPRNGWNPTGLEQGSCYHALGHLLMYVTNADLNQALPLCIELAKREDGRDLSQLCFDGAFMQIFQPLETEDFALVAGKAPTLDQLPSFCKQFKGKAMASCWTEGWPLSINSLKEPGGLEKYCSHGILKTREDIDRCYMAEVYVLTAQLQFSIPGMQELCNALQKEHQGICYANVASRMIETDYRNITKSIELCNTAPAGAKESCYQELIKYSTYNFHADSQEFYKLCNEMEDPWKQSCLSKG